MQHTLLHLEYTRTIARERSRGTHVQKHPPPLRLPRKGRRRVAVALARLAWRLDREAALRAWP